MDDKELAREGMDPRPAKDVAGSGGIFFDIAVGPDLIRGGYSMQRYVWFFAYVCMYAKMVSMVLCMHVCLYVCVYRDC